MLDSKVVIERFSSLLACLFRFYRTDLQAFRNKYTSSSKATSPSGVRSNSISDGSKTDDTDNTRRKGNIADSIEDTTVDNTVTTVDLSILPRGSESNEADQSHTLGVESEIIDGEKQLQPRIEEKKLRDQSLVDARSLDDEDQQEQLAQKVERHRRKNNALKDFKQTTRVYKDNSDVQLYTQKQNINKNLRYMNRTQFKQQGLYSKQLYNKFNELQKLKSLLLPKLGLNNVINYS